MLPGLLAMLMVTVVSSWSQVFGYPAREAVFWYIVSIDFNPGNDIAARAREMLLLRFKQELGVVAVKNDEMAFFKELFDSYIYKDGRGKIVKGRLVERPGFPDGFVRRVPDDLDWVGLLNSQEDFGFFSRRLDYRNSGLDCAGEWVNKPGTNFYAPADGKYVYRVRPLVYNWAEYPTRNILFFVPAGSRFYEKIAIWLYAWKMATPRG